MMGKLSRSFRIAAAVSALALGSAAAFAAPESFQVQLSGAQQVPAVQTGGTATADLTYDPDTKVLTWSVSYSGLSSDVTMGHFHTAAAGKNGKPALWITKQGSAVSNPITGQATLTDAQAKQLLAGGMAEASR